MNTKLVTLRADIAYLQDTLIPELRESGMDATADDFVMYVEHMNSYRMLLEKVEQLTQVKDR